MFLDLPFLPQMVSRRDFEGVQQVRGRDVNVLEGLELHAGVLSPGEQDAMVSAIYDLVRQVEAQG